MNITPLDIQQKQFHVGFRGYERGEVDAFLDLVREEMESLLREVTELRDFRRAYDERLIQLQEKEELVKNTIVLAQKLAEDVKESARKEAALIVKDSELRSRQIMGNSQQEKVRMDAEVQELRRKKYHFLQDLKKVVQMHMELVNFEEGGGEAKEGNATE
jgi:cell division initiation protein